MILMFVRQQDAIEMVRTQSDGFEAQANLTSTQSCVKEQGHSGGLQDSAITRTTTAENRELNHVLTHAQPKNGCNPN